MPGHCNDTMNLDPAWTKGNVVVICSTALWFRVYDYTLYAASQVTKFAGARVADDSSSASGAKAGDPSTEFTLSFTGDNAVTSDVFRLFLEVATTLKLPSGPDAPSKLLLGPLVRFLKKWGCDALYGLVISKITEQVRNHDTYPLQAFNIGAVTGEIEICKAALREHTWPSEWQASDPWWDEGASHYPFNTRGWSLRLYREHTIPRDYLFALAKAKDLNTGSLAERFEKCILKAKETAEGQNTGCISSDAA